MKTQQETNILPFDCPFWKKETLIIITQTEDPEERSRFFSHCAKCNICKRKALEILGNDSSIKPNKTKRFYITVLIAAMLLVFFGVVYKNREALKYPDLQRSTSIVLTNGNLYDQLDTTIDNYLENKTDLSEAKKLSKEIFSKYKDRWGIDLVNYYSTVQKDKAGLLETRQLLNKLLTNSVTDDLNENRKIAEALEQELLNRGDTLEQYKAKMLVEKICMLQNDLGYKTIYNEGLVFSERHGYKYLNLYFRVWDSKMRSNKSSEDLEVGFKSLIEESKLLEINDLTSSLEMTLAGIYETKNRDKEAVELAEEALLLSQNSYTRTANILHVAAIASFKIGQKEKAYKCLDQSLKVAVRYKNNYLTALTYSLFANCYTSEGKPDIAEEYLVKAENLSVLVNDDFLKNTLDATVNGYKGKNELAKKDYVLAGEFYQKARSLLMRDPSPNEFILEELNNGIAICLEKLGKKESLEYRAIAQEHKILAEKNNIEISCFLSFLPDKCK